MIRLSSTTDRITLLTERVLGTLLSEIPEALHSDLLKRVSALVEEEVQRERDRCVRLCRERADLWQRTLAATAPGVPAAREEARARSNEATYLADLLEQGEDR
jgi:negative regulator of sigma E activity